MSRLRLHRLRTLLCGLLPALLLAGCGEEPTPPRLTGFNPPVLAVPASETLEITAFERARDYGEHFKAYYGPTIAVRANAEREGRAEEFDAALDAFSDEWNRGSSGRARFEKEYLIAVGTRTR